MGGVEAHLHTFLTLALDEDEWLALCHSLLYSVETKLGGAQSQSGHGGREEKILATTGNQTPSLY